MPNIVIMLQNTCDASPHPEQVCNNELSVTKFVGTITRHRTCAVGSEREGVREGTSPPLD